MKLIDFIKYNRLLEYKITLEIRKNNIFVKEETIDNEYNLSKQFIDSNIDDWFIDFDNEKIIVNLK